MCDHEVRHVGDASLHEEARHFRLRELVVGGAGDDAALEGVDEGGIEHAAETAGCEHVAGGREQIVDGHDAGAGECGDLFCASRDGIRDHDLRVVRVAGDDFDDLP